MNNNWVKEYKSKVMPNSKSLQEIYDWLSKEFQLIELSKIEIQGKYHVRYEVFKQNCEYITGSKSHKIKLFELSSENLNKYFIDADEEPVLLVEENNFIIECDSNTLYREIMLKKGVDPYDYENDTTKLMEYIILKFNLNKR